MRLAEWSLNSIVCKRRAAYTAHDRGKNSQTAFLGIYREILPASYAFSNAWRFTLTLEAASMAFVSGMPKDL